MLVFPCGAENSIEIHHALKDVVNIKLFGASGKDDHGCFVYENYIGAVPYISSQKFISVLNEIIYEFNIDIIFPTHDDVVVKLAEEQDNIHAIIAISGLKQALISRSKKKTYDFFKEYDFCPKVFHSIPSPDQFPIFAKPDEGQGGKGALVVKTRNSNFLSNDLLNEYVLCEFLPGEELTIDCFTDRNNDLKFVGPRSRDRIFGGISVRSSTIPLTHELNEIAKAISHKMGMNGLWYFQVKKDVNNQFKLLEVSIRTAGTMNLYRGLGVNFPLLTVYNALGFDIKIHCNDYELIVDRALQNKYIAKIEFDTIYIDFDDTITRNGYVNPEVIMFLYNAKLHKKQILLITKHQGDINQTLDKLAIHCGLFDEIIHLKMNEEKYKHIKYKENCVFIDNSYKERDAVKKNLDIPTFDVDAISTLINWRN